MFLGVSVTGEVHRLPTEPWAPTEPPHTRGEGEGRPEQLREEYQDLCRESGSSVVSKDVKSCKME